MSIYYRTVSPPAGDSFFSDNDNTAPAEIFILPVPLTLLRSDLCWRPSRCDSMHVFCSSLGFYGDGSRTNGGLLVHTVSDTDLWNRWWHYTHVIEMTEPLTGTGTISHSHK